MLDRLSFTLAQDGPPAQAVSQAPRPAGNGGATPTATTQVPAEFDGMADAPSGGGGGMDLMLLLLMVLVVMWVFLLMGQRKEKRKRLEVLSKLSKGDRVETVGGILGTVIEVRDDEVLVKVDENANTRLRFTRAAIKSIVNKE